jgi:hypothetical protein
MRGRSAGSGYVLPLAYLWGVWRALREGERGAVLLLSWVVTPLVLFAPARTEPGWYITMIYPPPAWLLAIALAGLLTARVPLGAVAVEMVACGLRSPTHADGSPEVKALARYATQILSAGEVVCVLTSACAHDHPPLTAGELFATAPNIHPYFDALSGPCLEL